MKSVQKPNVQFGLVDNRTSEIRTKWFGFWTNAEKWQPNSINKRRNPNVPISDVNCMHVFASIWFSDAHFVFTFQDDMDLESFGKKKKKKKRGGIELADEEVDKDDGNSCCSC